jgi:hypothetical protein
VFFSKPKIFNRMKKLTLFLCMLYFAFNNNCLGDSWTDYKNCNWFSYRYHAYASVFIKMSGQDENLEWDDTFINVSYQHDKACSFDVSVSASYSGYYYASLPNSNYQCVTGWATMQYGPSGIFPDRYVVNPDYILAGTKTISRLTQPKTL